MSVVGIVLLAVKRRKQLWKGIFTTKSVFLLSGLISAALWYAMGNSMQDYKKVMFGSFFWLLIVVKAFLGTEEMEEVL